MKITFRNTTVHFKSKGKGRVIVLLHGFLETSDMWLPFISQILKSHQVITIDLLGHGKTGCVDKTHSMNLMAESVNEVLKNLNVEKVSIIGHSMGGYVALAFAEKYPKKITDLCLMNSTFFADDNERKQLRLRAIDIAKNHYKNLVQLSFMNLFSEESKLNFETEIKEALTLALKTPVEGFFAAHDGMRLRPDRFEIFNNIKGNKLIILGKKDTLINQSQIQSKIKNTNTSLIVLSEGHMSHIENKTELFEVLKKFLKI